MAALTVTAANVDAGTDGEIGTGTAGAAITAGQVIYYDRTTLTYKLAITTSEAAAKAAGVAVCDAAVGQIVAFQRNGSYTAGATLTKGLVYYASPTAGGISPVADIISTNYVTILGVASSASVLKLGINPTGITV